MKTKILDNGVELNYCPNCGGEPRLEIAFVNKPTRCNDILHFAGFRNLADYTKLHFVRCAECGLGTLGCENQEQAVELWNSKKDLS